MTVAPRKAPSKRKAEGIFYTPPFVTSYLVRETLGKVFQERWEASIQGKNVSKKEQLAKDGPAIAALAHAEGLHAHARAIEVRAAHSATPGALRESDQ